MFWKKNRFSGFKKIEIWAKVELVQRVLQRKYRKEGWTESYDLKKIYVFGWYKATTWRHCSLSLLVRRQLYDNIVLQKEPGSRPTLIRRLIKLLYFKTCAISLIENSTVIWRRKTACGNRRKLVFTPKKYQKNLHRTMGFWLLLP